MKKFFLLVAAVMLSAVATFAQTEEKIGIRIGMNFADFTNQPVDSRVGLHLGGVYNLPLGDSPLSLQPGLFYSQRNMKGDGNSDNWKISTHHVELPVLVKYNLEVADNIAIDPHVGPYFGMALGGKAFVKDIDDSESKIFKAVKKGGWGYKNMDMGIQTGCGATFFDVVYAGIDYQWGFNELGTTLDGKSVRNHNFLITFGVWFGN
ncbi:MAG: PorT family protein [Bacteroidales bacterium]|nr:PorT family protein [Bacteroidales bacterium]